MPSLIVLALIGVAAQLVDGGLGMGYGVFSSTMLVIAGLSPAVASASVHLAEIGTSLASGVAHWRFRNVDWRIAVRIGLPGAVGAFAGATLLSNLPGDVAKPWMSAILLILGVAILVRFAGGRRRAQTSQAPLRTRFLAPLGLFAGAVDATGGGGWGPVATPALIATDRLEPAKAVGTVNTAEFAVAVAASLGFLLHLDGGVDWKIVGALLVGGAVAAPVAAWLVRMMPAHYLGLGVGGLIIATNARTILVAAGAPDLLRYAAYSLIVAAWAAVLTYAVRARRLSRVTV
ncbi:sulfite exporter TauE/SafE family protein [Phytomonospora sp. NPDC050363]|uniref:sulfite exporter TauE/SafE family protein n=1 Tax=Phytomonospora sp. NPDC050363 TaxID=3155642 RepID=UPI00340B169A